MFGTKKKKTGGVKTSVKDADLLAKYPQMSLDTHMKSKDMYAGSGKKSAFEEYFVDEEGVIDFRSLSLPPKVNNCVWEVAINVSDHKMRYPDLVKNMDVSFDDTGLITIYNTGPGMDVDIHPTARVCDVVPDSDDTRPIYIPEFLVGFAMSSTNHSKDIKSIIGGTNGFGIKIVNLNSTYFKIETVGTNYEGNIMKYEQEFENCRTIIHKPKIKKCSKTTKQYTRISFRLDYANMSYKSGLSEKHLNIIGTMIRTRTYQMATWLTSRDGARVTVRYNGEKIPIGSLSSYAKLLTDNSAITEFPLSYTMKFDDKSTQIYNWKTAVAIRRSDSTECFFGMLNGIHTTTTKHLKRIQDILIRDMKPALEKIFAEAGLSFQQASVRRLLYIFALCEIPEPSWKGQTKTEFDLPKNFSKMLDSTIPSSVIKTLTSRITEVLREEILPELLDKKTDKKKTRKKRIDAKQYVGAERAGTSDSLSCKLFIAEGLSAVATVKDLITSKFSDLSFKTCGTFWVQGGLVNARKETTITTIGDHTSYKFRAKLKNNAIWNSFMDATGLDYDKKYETDINGLRYGQIIIACDQDLDGVGKILSLIINAIDFFWPMLFKRGFVKRWLTPIIKMLPKTGKTSKKYPPILFYYEREYEEWIKSTSKKVIDKYKPKYY